MDLENNPYRSPLTRTLGDRHRTPRSRRGPQWVMGLPASVSIWTGLFYIYVLRVVFALGRWPNSIGDHAGLDSGYHWHVLAHSMILLFLFVPTATALIVAFAIGSERYRMPRTWSALIVTWMIVLFITQADPGGHFQWFLD